MDENPMCWSLLRQVLDLLRDSGAHTVEQLAVLQAAISLVPALKYRPIPELLAESAAGPDTEASPSP